MALPNLKVFRMKYHRAHTYNQIPLQKKITKQGLTLTKTKKYTKKSTNTAPTKQKQPKAQIVTSPRK